MRGEELVFLGWPDIAGLTRGRGIPLADLEERLPVWQKWLKDAGASGPTGLEDHARRLSAIEREVEAARKG